MKATITTTATLDVGTGVLVLLLALAIAVLVLATWKGLRAPGWVRGTLGHQNLPSALQAPPERLSRSLPLPSPADRREGSEQRL